MVFQLSDANFDYSYELGVKLSEQALRATHHMVGPAD